MPIKRPVKMLLYAPPGTGKSVFAAHFPKPFFICTDGNYEWLLDFGAKAEDHININSFAEFERIVQNDFAGYDTIVVDLLEDIYKWNEYEFCRKQKVDHLSDAGGYGKGWDITRTRMFVACSKLLALPKNIIFLSHESSYNEKDRKGNEKTKYQPSNLLPEKFMIMLEGRLRYVLRARFEDEVTEDGKVVMHRVLSLVPKSNEYGIIRGVNTDIMPEDIDLDAKTFLQVIGYVENDTAEDKAPVESTPLPEQKEEQPAQPATQPASTQDDKAAKLAAMKAKFAKAHEQPASEPKSEVKPEPIPEPTPAPESEPEPEPTPVEEKPIEEKPAVKTVIVEEKVEVVQEPLAKPESQDDKIAKIKAKLAAKANKK